MERIISPIDQSRKEFYECHPNMGVNQHCWLINLLKSGKTRKGNHAIRSILCEIANAARRTKSQFKGKYESLVIRRGHKRNIIALGHKILRVIFVMLKNVRPYFDPGIDYEELMVDRNAPRWLQVLKKFGYLPQTA